MGVCKTTLMNLNRNENMRNVNGEAKKKRIRSQRVTP